MIDSNERLNDTFDALANKHRRAILYRLSLQPRSISQLANEQELSHPAIHRHIKILEQAKLIKRRKSGRTNFLSIDRTGLLELRNWIDQYHAYWGSQEETLENYVASIERANLKLKGKK